MKIKEEDIPWSEFGEKHKGYSFSFDIDVLTCSHTSENIVCDQLRLWVEYTDSHYESRFFTIKGKTRVPCGVMIVF